MNKHVSRVLWRFRLLRRMLEGLGIEGERLRLEWISAAEGEKVRQVVRALDQGGKRFASKATWAALVASDPRAV